jgi:hypothetical protein
METLLRAALLDWLRADPTLSAGLNAMTEEAPARAIPPWLGVVASASADWSVKDATGREVRIALELHLRGDDPATGAILGQALEGRIAALPRLQEGFEVASIVFLRSRVEQRPGNTRAALFEYRFRLFATQPE